MNTKINRIYLLIAIMTLLPPVLFGQTSDTEWTPVVFQNQLAYIDLSNMGSFQGDDIFVWVSEKHSEPISIESVKSDIYKTHTYYLINKTIRRYSMVEILYFDKSNNVIKNFSYEVSESEIPDIKYNYPILEGSLIDKILQRCEIEIERSNEKVQ